jgi:hypothetical protein
MLVKAAVRIGLACVVSLLFVFLVLDGLHRYLVASGLERESATMEPTAGEKLSSADRPRQSHRAAGHFHPAQ